MQDPGELKKLIQRWSEELGFDGIGVAGIDINEDEKYLNKWLEKKFSSGKLIDTLELAAEFSKKCNIELHLSETIVGQWVKLKTGKAGI